MVKVPVSGDFQNSTTFCGEARPTPDCRSWYLLSNCGISVARGPHVCALALVAIAVRMRVVFSIEEPPRGYVSTDPWEIILQRLIYVEFVFARG